MSFPTVPLGDLCDIIGGGTPSKKIERYYEGDIPWASVRDMNVDRLSETQFKITQEALENSSSKIIPSGSVIIATRVGLGKVCVLENDTAINQDLRGILPKNKLKIDSQFLFYWFQFVSKTLQNAGTGATVKGVKLPFVKSLPFPDVTLEEQKRIVAVLDAAFEGLDRARAHTEANLQNARDLFTSHLEFAFDNLQLNSERKPISEIADHSLGKMLDKRKNKGSYRPYLRNLNVRWFKVDSADVKEMRVEEREIERYAVEIGDLLICEGGYPGRAAIWEGGSVMFFQKALHRVRFEEPIYNKLLMYYLFYMDFTDQLKDSFSGTGIQHFTGKALGRLKMPFPSLAECKSVVRKIETLKSETSLLSDCYETKLTDLDDLRQSLLQKAFAGELT